MRITTTNPGELINRRQPVWRLVAAIWSMVYLLCAGFWLLGGSGFPYGYHWDPAPEAMSLMDGVPRQVATAIMTSAIAAAVLAAMRLLLNRRAGTVARIATIVGGCLCLAMIIVGDYRLLLAIARTPVFLLMKTFLNQPAALGYGDFFAAMYTLPVWHQAWQLAGIAFWGLAIREFWVEARRGCGTCGRPPALSRWTTRSGARRWGRVATIIAIACPVPYAVSRYLLALGIPADGFSRAQVVQMSQQMPGVWIAGAGLASLGVIGGLLTLGLIQRWGERWPFWVPALRGRPINPKVAIVPASAVALLMPGASVMYARIQFHHFTEGEKSLVEFILSPTHTWLVWGFALAAATAAYWLRRRPDCNDCHRGEEAIPGVWAPKSRRGGRFREGRAGIVRRSLELRRGSVPGAHTAAP